MASSSFASSEADSLETDSGSSTVAVGSGCKRVDDTMLEGVAGSCYEGNNGTVTVGIGAGIGFCWCRDIPCLT